MDFIFSSNKSQIFLNIFSRMTSLKTAREYIFRLDIDNSYSSIIALKEKISIDNEGSSVVPHYQW